MYIVGFMVLFESLLVDSISIDHQFLRDFFKNKNVGITVHNCWNHEKNRMFLKEMSHVSHPRSVGFFRDSTDVASLKTWSNSNYFILDLRDCPSSDIILDRINNANIFVYPLKYILLLAKSQFSFVSEKLTDYFLLPNSELIMAVFDEESVFLHQPYKVGKTNELTWENYGNWSLERGLFEYYSNVPTPQRRANLKRANLNVVIVIYENDTWNHLTDYKDPGVDTFTKQDFLSMKCVFEHLNINYSLTGVDSYGYVNKTTGEFNGLVYEVQSGKADVSGVSIYFTEERYNAVDLIKMGNPLAIRFILRKPATSYMKNIFFITFNTSVWIASIIVIIICAIVVKIILNWEAKHKKNVKQDKYTVSDVTLIALEAICQQGTATEPQSFAGRILALILFGAYMFIYVSYSANIVVLLQSTTEVNNIKELIRSRIEVGGAQTHYMRNYFESVKKGPLRQLYLKKIYPDQYFPLEKGMKKLRAGNFAFHVLLQGAYEYILKNFTNYEICGLQELPGYIEENRGYVAVPKHSPYKDIFKVAILKVDEYGLQRRTNLRIIMKPTCFSHLAAFKSIGIYDCYQVFWVWIFGVALSFVFFSIEKLMDGVIMKKIASRRMKINQH